MNGGLLIRDHWIDGMAEQFDEERFAVEGPAVGYICDIPNGGAEAVEQACLSAERSDWPKLTARERSRLLWKLAEEIDARRVEFAKVDSHDMGKPVSDAESIDVENAVRWLEYASGWPKRTAGEVLPVGDHHCWTWREPVGPVAAITPWNYPLMLAVWKLAPALAAGCPVVLKPSERAPLSCLLLANLATMIGFPHGALNVVCGDGMTGRLLIENERIRKVSFTGSAAVGRLVGEVCGARSKPLTTELGGKSAAVVLPSAVPGSVAAVVEGLAHNAGQACNAPARLIYDVDNEDEVLSELEAAVGGMPDVGPLVDRRAVESVTGYVSRALDEGTAEEVARSGHDGRNRHPLTALKLEFLPSEIWSEEVFGPVILAAAVGGIDQAIAAANDSPYDLAAGIFGDEREARRIAHRLRAGHVYINCWSVQDPCAPFGGMGGSGVGREHGAEGYGAFLRTKTVFAA